MKAIVVGVSGNSRQRKLFIRRWKRIYKVIYYGGSGQVRFDVKSEWLLGRSITAQEDK